MQSCTEPELGGMSGLSIRVRVLIVRMVIFDERFV